MTQTLHLQAEDADAVQRAAAILRRGGLVAFATETVYGLGANALSAKAVAGIFAAKGRPAWDPLIVHLAELSSLPAITSAEARGRVRVLADAFWPGPFTMLLPRTESVPDEVTAGRPLVGVRLPAHPATQALLRAAGLPIAAPSANLFGHVSPTTAEHVLADLDGRIDAVLDAGPCRVGVESTVVDPATTPITVYRAGAVTVEEIERVSGAPARFFEPPAHRTEDPSSLPSPGVGIRHYAPRVPLQLCAGTPSAALDAVQVLKKGGRRVGVLLPDGWPVADLPVGTVTQRWGNWNDPAELAYYLFAGLRALEASGAEILVCPMPAAGGMQDALRDRLIKAAMPMQRAE